MKILSGPTCVAKVGDVCGEGAVWHAAEAALYWADINRFLIHRYDSNQPRCPDVGIFGACDSRQSDHAR